MANPPLSAPPTPKGLLRPTPPFLTIFGHFWHHLVKFFFQIYPKFFFTSLKQLEKNDQNWEKTPQIFSARSARLENNVFLFCWARSARPKHMIYFP